MVAAGTQSVRISGQIGRSAGDAQIAAGMDAGAQWRVAIGKHFPAMTLVQVSALIDPNATVEIEADAVLP